MKRLSKLQRTGLLVVILLLGAAAWAQDTASITGTVTDSSGAAVPNAQIAVKNTEHGINRSSTSNGSGDFLFASLPLVSWASIESVATQLGTWFSPPPPDRSKYAVPLRIRRRMGSASTWKRASR